MSRVEEEDQPESRAEVNVVCLFINRSLFVLNLFENLFVEYVFHKLFLSALGLNRLHARLKLNKAVLGIGKAKVREDLCPVCHTYDIAVVRDMKSTVRYCHDKLKALNPHYFDNWEHHDAFQTCNIPHDNLEWWHECRNWIGDGHTRRGVDHDELLEKERECCKLLDARIDELMHWMVHWQLRDHMKAALVADLQDPGAGRSCIWSDWKELVY